MLPVKLLVESRLLTKFFGESEGCGQGQESCSPNLCIAQALTVYAQDTRDFLSKVGVVLGEA